MAKRRRRVSTRRLVRLVLVCVAIGLAAALLSSSEAGSNVRRRLMVSTGLGTPLLHGRVHKEGPVSLDMLSHARNKCIVQRSHWRKTWKEMAAAGNTDNEGMPEGRPCFNCQARGAGEPGLAAGAAT